MLQGAWFEGKQTKVRMPQEHTHNILKYSTLCMSDKGNTSLSYNVLLYYIWIFSSHLVFFGLVQRQQRPLRTSKGISTSCSHFSHTYKSFNPAARIITTPTFDYILDWILFLRTIYCEHLFRAQKRKKNKQKLCPCGLLYVWIKSGLQRSICMQHSAFMKKRGV